jgi:hypothetical protein
MCRIIFEHHMVCDVRRPVLLPDEADGTIPQLPPDLLKVEFVANPYYVERHTCKVNARNYFSDCYHGYHGGNFYNRQFDDPTHPSHFCPTHSCCTRVGKSYRCPYNIEHGTDQCQDLEVLNMYYRDLAMWEECAVPWALQINQVNEEIFDFECFAERDAIQLRQQLFHILDECTQLMLRMVTHKCSADEFSTQGQVSSKLEALRKFEDVQSRRDELIARFKRTRNILDGWETRHTPPSYEEAVAPPRLPVPVCVQADPEPENTELDFNPNERQFPYQLIDANLDDRGGGIRPGPDDEEREEEEAVNENRDGESMEIDIDRHSPESTPGDSDSGSDSDPLGELWWANPDWDPVSIAYYWALDYSPPAEENHNGERSEHMNHWNGDRLGQASPEPMTVQEHDVGGTPDDSRETIVWAREVGDDDRYTPSGNTLEEAG